MVASLALVSYSTVGLWMPLFRAQQHGWSTAEYGSFYIWWALFATTGFWAGGWMTLARLLRCQPFGTSGLDFVPNAAPESARWYLPWRYARWRGTNAPAS